MKSPACLAQCFGGRKKYELADHGDNANVHMSPKAIESSIFGAIDYGKDKEGAKKEAGGFSSANGKKSKDFELKAEMACFDAPAPVPQPQPAAPPASVQAPLPGSGAGAGAAATGAGLLTSPVAFEIGEIQMGLEEEVFDVPTELPNFGAGAGAAGAAGASYSVGQHASSHRRGSGGAPADSGAAAVQPKLDRWQTHSASGESTSRSDFKNSRQKTTTTRSFPPVGITLYVQQTSKEVVGDVFENAFVQDIAGAMDMHEDRLRIVGHTLERDSMLLTVRANIMSLDNGDDRSPLQIAATIAQLSETPGSLLKKGLVSSRLVKVAIEECPHKEDPSRQAHSNWRGGVAMIIGMDELSGSMVPPRKQKKSQAPAGGLESIGTEEMNKILLPRPARTGASTPVLDTLNSVSQKLASWKQLGGVQRWGG